VAQAALRANRADRLDRERAISQPQHGRAQIRPASLLVIFSPLEYLASADHQRAQIRPASLLVIFSLLEYLASADHQRGCCPSDPSPEVSGQDPDNMSAQPLALATKARPRGRSPIGRYCGGPTCPFVGEVLTIQSLGAGVSKRSQRGGREFEPPAVHQLFLRRFVGRGPHLLLCLSGRVQTSPTAAPGFAASAACFRASDSWA